MTVILAAGTFFISHSNVTKIRAERWCALTAVLGYTLEESQWPELLTMCFDIGIVTCGPNEALIISGMFQGNDGSLVVGGRAIVLPGDHNSV